MKPFPANKNDKNEFSLLPANIGQALKFLIVLSEKLVSLSEQETQALIRNDMASFSILQDEKETFSLRYSRGSEEFRERLEEFRDADQTLLNRLETLQKQLADITKSNKEIVSQMFLRSKKNTHESLITVQELAQSKPVSGGATNSHSAQQQEGA